MLQVLEVELDCRCQCYWQHGARGMGKGLIRSHLFPDEASYFMQAKQNEHL